MIANDYIIICPEEDLIYKLNKLAAHATVDGGDAGGPYEQNEEGMVSIMTDIITTLKLNCKIEKRYVKVEGFPGMWPVWQFVEQKEVK